ncbi:phenylalanine 4-monooxygenase [Variovorax sp. PCZ-1]|uniref:phenylalanine 4-monooxygenase n=1 Tax=Variovorax sp. PCZ-1 TaxID=2835533 RepID=UPI001BCDD4B0|nr:phenylalanine 4-monooxygenase [Variovorax sp. PCZ-1]MBS7806111.1 phenylalanine 4-monooxygenase [Variovorax sp. PCZ-1]
MAVKPVIYGQSDRPPRGDYSRAREDYTCDQNFTAYTEDDHDTWRKLYSRQRALLPGLAAQRFIDLLPQLNAAQGIPRFEDINARLLPATGWQLVGVPGLIPEVPFFTLLANRKFPVTDWIRTPAEMDYVVEPDIFHDLFGHVPLLFDRTYADHIQAYGQGALKAHALENKDESCQAAVEHLSRLYWYTIEFGLQREGEDVRAYGAGILSSPGELAHSVQSPEPERLPLTHPQEILRCMASTYKIDSYQSQYFVIENFEALLALTAPDFTPYYRQLALS